MRYDDAPAAGFPDFRDSFGDAFHIVPPEGSRLCLSGRNAFRLICHAKHADSAGFFQINRFGGLCHINPSANGSDIVFCGMALCTQKPFQSGIHGMIVSDRPDVCLHFIQNIYGSRIHRMEEGTAASIVFCFHHCSLHVCNYMVSSAKEIKHGFFQQIFICPPSLHISVEPDVTGKYN